MELYGGIWGYIVFHPYVGMDMNGFQNYGPFFGTLKIKCRIIIGIQKGTRMLTTTHIECWALGLGFRGFSLELKWFRV